MKPRRPPHFHVRGAQRCSDAGQAAGSVVQRRSLYLDKGGLFVVAIAVKEGNKFVIEGEEFPL